MTQPGIETQSLGQLAKTLPTWPMGQYYIYIYIYIAHSPIKCDSFLNRCIKVLSTSQIYLFKTYSYLIVTCSNIYIYNDYR